MKFEQRLAAGISVVAVAVGAAEVGSGVKLDQKCYEQTCTAEELHGAMYRELAGCTLIFTAMVLQGANLIASRRRRTEKEEASIPPEAPR